jgi:tripartite ATP-independent transporter DctM subunit
MSVLLTSLVTMMALAGMPLFVVLAAAGYTGALRMELDPAVLVLELHRLATSPNLVAVPLFTLAGVLLAEGGAATRLVRVFNALVGWLPGGIAVVALCACAFFTAFSGASGVTILALGGLLYPMLAQTGYKERFNLGLLTTSGSLGLLFPPSLALILYAIVAQLPIEQLFLAGLLPGLLLLIMLIAFSLHNGRTLPSQPFSLRELRAALRVGGADLLLPVAIIVGIQTGTVTVSEAAACTAAYALLLECVIHRALADRARLYDAFTEAAILTATILMILGVALGLTNLMVDAQIPMRLVDWFSAHIESPLAFLLLLNGFLLLVGCAMDIFSAIVVIVPLLLPLAARYGVDPLHLGIIFLANLELGYSTPPIGINLFIASQRFGRPILTLFRAALPFITLMLVWLLIITYLPQTTLWWRSAGIGGQSLAP